MCHFFLAIIQWTLCVWIVNACTSKQKRWGSVRYKICWPQSVYLYVCVFVCDWHPRAPGFATGCLMYLPVCVHTYVCSYILLTLSNTQGHLIHLCHYTISAIISSPSLPSFLRLLLSLSLPSTLFTICGRGCTTLEEVRPQQAVEEHYIHGGHNG